MTEQHPDANRATDMKSDSTVNALRLLRRRIKGIAMRPHRQVTTARGRSVARSYPILGLLTYFALCTASGDDRLRASAVMAQAGPDAAFEWAMETRFGNDQKTITRFSL